MHLLLFSFIFPFCSFFGNSRAQQSRYQNLVTNYLYNKTMDSGQGVRAYIVDSTLQQEIKEALLAYFFLWQDNAHVSLGQPHINVMKVISVG